MAGRVYIETPRLLLRDWREADIEPWAQLNADPRVMEFFPGTFDRARSESTAALMRAHLESQGFGWWALEVKDRLAFAGIIALQMVPGDMPFAPAMEIGWRLAFDAWGRGYATEGARAALDFAFARPERDEIVALTAAINRRSQRVMQKLGMTHSANDDFDHPRIGPGLPLRPHVLYRLGRDAYVTQARSRDWRRRFA